MGALKGSCEHQKKHNLTQMGMLNPRATLTLTIVTNSLANTNLVKEYFSSFNKLSLKQEDNLNLKLMGNVSQLSQIFNTTFMEYKCNMKHTCFASTSDIVIPMSLHGAIVGILGLEQVLNFKPNFKSETISSPRQASASYLLGSQAAQIYGVPSSNGAGIRVGIISLGGYFTQQHLQDYFTLNGLGQAPRVNVVLVDGARLDFVDRSGASGENYLDVEIIASVVPQANITLYFAPNTARGFYNVLATALQNSNVVSVSWGSDERGNPRTYMDMYQALFARFSNVPIFIATGDLGSNGAVGFPSNCPNAIGCGGTTLNYNGRSISSVTRYVSETSWSGSNGGFSTYFTRPLYQQGIHTNVNRGVPDLSSDADPRSGYLVCYGSPRRCSKFGGTSAVSPLYAGITARLMNLNGVSQVQQDFQNGGYYKVLSFRDVTLGNNGGFTARQGWDAVTGLGSFSKYTPTRRGRMSMQ